MLLVGEILAAELSILLDSQLRHVGVGANPSKTLLFLPVSIWLLLEILSYNISV